jgi:hypothetical protein
LILFRECLHGLYASHSRRNEVVKVVCRENGAHGERMVIEDPGCTDGIDMQPNRPRSLEMNSTLYRLLVIFAASFSAAKKRMPGSLLAIPDEIL